MTSVDTQSTVSPLKTHDSGEIQLSVVMPCLNEARTVGVCVAKALASLERMGVHGEIIVADIGCPRELIDEVL